MKSLQTEFDRQRISLYRKELLEKLESILSEDGAIELYPGITVFRSSYPTDCVPSVFKPALCVIAQGAKNVVLSGTTFRYDSGNYLISTLDLPITSSIVQASVSEPYLSLRLDLEAAAVAEVALEAGVKVNKVVSSEKAMNVSPLDADLLEAVLKLIRLVESQAGKHFLIQLTIKEIIFRLFNGNQSERLKHMIAAEGDAKRISKAVKILRENYQQPIRIEKIARELGMSVSGFHHHFKSVTSMSPLQFLKQIRLQEARRLMLSENVDVASAGFRVGYLDAAYFSRDYKKLFGEPPLRDVMKLRSSLNQSDIDKALSASA
jgi:AraC-like DNA-binding protein